MPRDYYEVLGVDREASEAEIKKAFRAPRPRAAPRRQQPRPGGGGEVQAGGRGLRGPLATPSGAAPTTPSATRACARGGWAPHAAGSDRGHPLLALRRRRLAVRRPLRRRARPGRPPGGDIGVEVEITLAEVLTGVAARGRLRGGLGLRALPRQRRRARDADPHLRDLRRRRPGAAGAPHRVRPARADRRLPDLRRRRARSPSSPASSCDGAGREVRERTWDVEVPAGIESGQRIRIAGAGHAGEPGGAAGRPLRPGPRRRGRALRAPRPGPGHRRPGAGDAGDARRRGRRSPTLDGEREVEIPAGAQPGARDHAQGPRPAVAARRPAAATQHVLVDVVIPRSSAASSASSPSACTSRSTSG